MFFLVQQEDSRLRKGVKPQVSTYWGGHGTARWVPDIEGRVWMSSAMYWDDWISTRQYAPPFNHATTSYFNSSKLNEGKEYEGIPGSSKCVKCVLFTQKNLPKNRNFTYMDDPGMSKHIYSILPYVNSTADEIFAATDGRPCLPATAAAGARWVVGDIFGKGWMWRFNIPYHPWDLYICLHDWLVFMGFHVGKHTNYTSPVQKSGDHQLRER